MDKKLLAQAKPMLFNTEMVQAILDDRKTVTRRVIKFKYSNTHFEWLENKYGKQFIEIQNDVEGETFGVNEDGSYWRNLLGYTEVNPKYQVGDYLYVRETFQLEGMTTSYDNDGTIIHQEIYYAYKADGFGHQGKWTPSIHMPKEAARILLKVTDVRVERLQDITPEQLKAEGIEISAFEVGNEFAEGIFHGIWDSTLPKPNNKFKRNTNSWSDNPWVFVYEFERVNDDE